MDEHVARMLMALDGERVTPEGVESIVEALPWAPAWLLDLMSRYPLANSTFTLDESDDLSGLGVEMKWVSPAAMIDEATAAYPGMAAARHGYVPVGTCLLGTGDPYFVRADSDGSPLFRIPHSAVRGDDLKVNEVEDVAPSLPAFFELALRNR